MKRALKIAWVRQLLAIVILVATIGFFAYYFKNNPEVGQRLAATPPLTLAAIFGLYIANVAAIALVTLATLKLCGIDMPKPESVKLTAYTLLVNFFGPLQSGPAFRAVYLKAKHNVNLKKYAAATLAYYLIYGILGVLCVASYWLDWRLALIILAGTATLLLAARTKRVRGKLKLINLRNGWFYLVAATTLQVIILTIIFYIELRSTAPGTSLHQAIIYSGAANLALFVSLTPGAIGFRESFLAITQQLHQVDGTTIIAANILDRSVYIIVLLILAIGIFATRTNKSLKA